MPPDFNLPFVLSLVGAFLTSSVIACTYVWPAVRAMPRYEALRILAAFHAFRFFGMNFMVAGFVSPQMNSSFGAQVGCTALETREPLLIGMHAVTQRVPIALQQLFTAFDDAAAQGVAGEAHAGCDRVLP